MKRNQRIRQFNKMFIKTLFILLSVFLISSSVSAQAVPAKQRALIETKIPTESLKNNLLGDSFEQDVAIYLPPSYETAKTKRYPAIYLLHGFGDSIQNWTKRINLKNILDDLIKSGEIREMIVVMPNGTNAYGGSFYTNSTVAGNWEDYIYKDLVAYVDKNYRTIPKAESRGIAGHSMGGYGAIKLSMKHPDVFSAVYGLSPCCLGFDGDAGWENPAWGKVLSLTSKEELAKPPQSFEDFFAKAFVATAAAFSPNPQKAPFFADFPYKISGNQLIANEPVYTLWREKMPLYQVEKFRDNLLKLRGIYFDVGQYDEFSHIRIDTRRFSEELSERNIPHGFEIYKDGDHNNKIRERIENKVLRFFSDTLNFEDLNTSK